MKLSTIYNNCIRCRTKRGDIDTNETLCKQCFKSILFQEDKNKIQVLKALLLRIHLAKEMNNPDSKAWIDLAGMFKDENYN
jgi:hypothetical protein